MNCEYCGKEINPILLETNKNFPVKVKYHPGCRLKANNLLRKKREAKT